MLPQPNVEVDLVILKAVQDMDGNVSAAYRLLVGHGVLHPAYTAQHVLDRFNEVVADTA